MGVGTRSPWTTTGGSYDDWRSVISKDLWLLRCSRLHRAQIAIIDMMITRMRTSAKKVWSPLRLLCTSFFLAAATVGACVGFCVGWSVSAMRSKNEIFRKMAQASQIAPFLARRSEVVTFRI